MTSPAFDPSAPADERFDAQAELQKSAISGGDIIPADNLRPLIDHVADLWREQQMLKASANVVPFPSRNAGKRGMQSVKIDDLTITLNGDFIERPGTLSFDMLRAMVDQTPVLSAVVLTRVRQVMAYAKVQESGDGPGYEIRHIDRDHSLTKGEQESISLLHGFFQNCGWEFNPRRRKALSRDSFPAFMAKLVRDSLVMDSCAIETEFKRDRKLGIDGLYAVDGSTIRLCDEEGYRGDDKIFALQVIQGQIRSVYTPYDLIYEPRNPRTDVMAAGYGLSETELLVRVVTGFLNAMTLNIRGFSDNSIPRGVLHLTGNYSHDDLAAFKRYWNSMVRGVNNSWTVPVLVSKDQESRAGFENFGVEFNEMYFSKWMTFLASIICAVYGIAPDEINFESFSASKSSLSGSDTAERLADSKDKGLRPLLSYFEGLFTDYVLAEFGDKYAFRWTGLDEVDQDKRHEVRKMILSINELRAEEGYQATDEMWGDAPANPSLVGPWMNSLQQAQQEEQPEQDMDGEDRHPDYQGGGDDEDRGGGQDAGGDESRLGDTGGGEDFGKSWVLLKSNDAHDKLGRFEHKHGERDGLMSMNAVVVHAKWPHEFDGDDRVRLREAALKKLKAWPKSGVTNDDTGWSLVVGRDDWKKMAKWNEQTVSGLHAIGDLEDIVRLAIRAETHADKNGNQSVFAVHRLYSPVVIDGQMHRVKLTVKDYVLTDGKERKNLHALEAVEIESPGERHSHDTQGTLNAAPPAQALGREFSMADLLHGVKRDTDGQYFGSEEVMAKANQYGVGIDDEVFYHHPEHGLTAGKVRAIGKDGFMLDGEQAPTGVLWDAFRGHKKRAERRYHLVDRGESGAIVEDPLTGKRHFVAGEIPDDDDDEDRDIILGRG